MCGRYLFSAADYDDDAVERIRQLAERFPSETLPKGDVYPSQRAPVLVAGGDKAELSFMTWGYPAQKGLIINARSETAANKPMFRDSWQTCRCAVPAAGYYEWDKAKRKFFFRLPEDRLLYLGGLYQSFQGESRFVILTRQAVGQLAQIHERMPLLVPKREILPFLAGEDIKTPPELKALPAE